MISFQLKPWYEIIGILRSIEVHKKMVVAKLSTGSLQYNRDNKEGRQLLEIQRLVGKRVGILCTDLDPPLRFRIIDGTDQDELSPFMKWWQMTYLIGGR